MPPCPDCARISARGISVACGDLGTCRRVTANDALARGVVRFNADCASCGCWVPALGLPGKGRPLDTFPADRLCHGHAVRVMS